jgi:predicted MPP superfamily phosphohydrolase
MNQIDFDNSENLFTILVTHQPIALEKLNDYPIDLEVA